MSAEVLLVSGRDGPLMRLYRLRVLWGALAIAGLCYLWARAEVIPGLTGFQPYVPFQVEGVGWWRRVLTMLTMVPQWVRLLFWPAHLQTEYGPPEFEVANGVAWTQLPGLLLVMATLSLIVALRKKAPLVAFGFAWVVIVLLPSSNFLIPTGILIAERTLFLPSVGAMLAVGALMPVMAWRLPTQPARRAAFAAVLLLIVMGVVRSANRTRVWRDNDTLFAAGVTDAPRSYRAHYMYGGWLFQHGKLKEGEQHIRTALKLYPVEPFVAYNLGEEYRKAGMYAQGATMFRRTLAIVPNYKDALGRLAMCLAEIGQLEEARGYAEDAIRQGNVETAVMLRILKAAAEDRRRRLPGFTGVLPDTLQNPRANGR